jgi:hypothetical protein
MRKNRRIDISKLTVEFRNFAKTHNNEISLRGISAFDTVLTIQSKKVYKKAKEDTGILEFGIGQFAKGHSCSLTENSNFLKLKLLCVPISADLLYSAEVVLKTVQPHKHFLGYKHELQRSSKRSFPHASVALFLIVQIRLLSSTNSFFFKD